MRIVGERFACTDGALRPVVEGCDADATGSDCQERFLVDSGADASVFAAGFVHADDGSPARIHGEFAAFTDPAAADMSILDATCLTILT